MRKNILSELDQKILQELDKNARTSSSRIAKTAGISKQLTIYRINRLEKSGVIRKYLVIIDPHRLGFSYYNVYLKMENFSGEIEKEFRSYLEASPVVPWFVRTIGSHDFIISFFARSPLEFSLNFKELINKYGNYIERDDLFIIIDAFKLQYKYLLDETGLFLSHYLGKKEAVSLKEEDLKILQLLDMDGRISVVKIANLLGISAPAVSYKIKNFLKQGIIQGFRPLLDHSVLGFQWYIISFKLNNPSEEEEKKFVAYLKQNKNIVYLTRGVGTFNLVLDIHVKDLVEMDSCLNEIRCRFGGMIKNYSSLLIVDNPKTSFFPSRVLKSSSSKNLGKNI